MMLIKHQKPFKLKLTKGNFESFKTLMQVSQLCVRISSKVNHENKYYSCSCIQGRPDLISFNLLLSLFLLASINGT